MDPNANYKEQVETAKRIMDRCERCVNADPEDGVRLAELVLSLNEWLLKGGFLPDAWKQESEADDMAGAFESIFSE